MFPCSVNGDEPWTALRKSCMLSLEACVTAVRQPGFGANLPARLQLEAGTAAHVLTLRSLEVVSTHIKRGVVTGSSSVDVAALSATCTKCTTGEGGVQPEDNDVEITQALHARLFSPRIDSSSCESAPPTAQSPSQAVPSCEGGAPTVPAAWLHRCEPPSSLLPPAACAMFSMQVISCPIAVVCNRGKSTQAGSSASSSFIVALLNVALWAHRECGADDPHDLSNCPYVHVI